MKPNEGNTPFQVGDWTVDPTANTLIRDHQEHHIEPKVMKVLVTLAQRQGKVFTKEELVATVWPNTFVSDDALTRCISILRRVVEDAPQDPHYIQTIPKVGYRLVAPVSFALEEAEEVPALGEAVEYLPPAIEPTAPQIQILEAPPLVETLPLAVLEERRTRSTFLLAAAATTLALVLCAIGGTIWYMKTRTLDAASLETTALTGDAGEQLQPAFSPSGKTIAYVQVNTNIASRRIYLKNIGQESKRSLNNDGIQQFSPVWSPDGKEIAYFGRSDAGLGIYIAATNQPNAAPRKVYIPQETSSWEQGGLSWSPDGKFLLFSDHVGNEASASIYQLDLATLRAQVITNPPDGAEGDLSPQYSPDGKKVAFTRATETAVRDLYWITLVDGVLHPLTHDRMNIEGFAWERDSSHIVFASNRAGKSSLWRIKLNGEQPVRMPVGSEDATQPAVGPLPGQLAYSQGAAIWNTDRVHMGEDGHSPENSILSSTQEDSAPTMAPDDHAFAFQSRRSGNQEIWVSSADGVQLRQLTMSQGPVTGSPSWSHRGDRILYDSRPDGHSHIFSIPASGGAPKQLTFGAVNDIIPRWSNDDQTVYFRSNRGGRWQVWKVSSNGGTPQPVTSTDGMAAQESADGKYLYYTHAEAAGLWRVALDGSGESMVQPQPAAGYWGYWQVTPHGIFYLDTSTTPSEIRIYDPQEAKSHTFAVLSLTPPPFQGLTVSHDGKTVLLTRESNVGRHITLVQRRAH
ncbi:DPP IV N-terminal domain-containing protein [Granulicella cerasi]|uniref:DPP IV N-terminal domain-containing protein n=1 Tax=Granulicella cerasi TaxID=741063 RepID=A0ABW1ZCB8_9BACT|nr:DPP IV N-terminal domain-containing protein [Granulicella cerasi]